MSIKFKATSHPSHHSQPSTPRPASAPRPASPPTPPSFLAPSTSYILPQPGAPIELAPPTALPNVNPLIPPHSTSPSNQPTPNPVPYPADTGVDNNEESSDDFVPRVPHNLVGQPPLPINWIWPDHIPMSKLTLIDGDPGSGKSLLALTIAAAVSSGQSLPGSDPLLPGTVLVVSPYDNTQDTILPRLLAAGADPARVFCLESLPTIDPLTGIYYERPLSLPEDLSFLGDHIGRLAPRLVILDSLTDMLDPRATCLVLSELSSMADVFQCAILLLRSVRTQPADLVRPRVTGHSAFKFAPAALLAVPHPQHPQQYILLPSRHTLSPTPTLLAYHITSTDQRVPTIHWIDAPPADLLPLLAGTGPRFSAQRYAILQCLRQHPTSLNSKEVATRICFDEEPVRKMLQRMHLVGDLTSPERGQYTTPNHPCLTPIPAMPPLPGVPPSTAPEPPLTNHRPKPHILPAAPPDDAISQPANSDVTPIETGAQTIDIQNAHVPNVPSPTSATT